MTAELEKQAVLQLAKEHKDRCDDEECSLSLFAVFCLLKRAGIEVSPKEQRLLM